METPYPMAFLKRNDKIVLMETVSYTRINILLNTNTDTFCNLKRLVQLKRESFQ